MSRSDARRVVVVGGGLVGLSAAFRLAEAGIAVTLVEAGRLLSGASSTSFAWVGASYPDALHHPAYFQLKQEATRARARLAERLGNFWLRETGAVVWASGGDELETLVAGVEELRRAGVPLATVSASLVSSAIEPSLSIPASARAAYFLPEDGYVACSLLAGALLRAFEAAGGQLKIGQAVEAVQRKGAAVSGLRLGSGELLQADIVVLAAGEATERLAATVGATAPLLHPDHPGSPTLGLIVTTRPSVSGLRRLAVGDGLMFRPDGNGRLLLHSYPHDALVFPGMQSERVLEVGREVLAATCARLVDAQDLEIESARIGVRPLPVDGQAILGFAPGLRGLYLAVSHSGVNLAPLMGEIAADEVGRGQRRKIAEPFRPDRFSTPPRGRS